MEPQLQYGSFRFLFVMYYCIHNTHTHTHVPVCTILVTTLPHTYSSRIEYTRILGVMVSGPRCWIGLSRWIRFQPVPSFSPSFLFLVTGSVPHFSYSFRFVSFLFLVTRFRLFLWNLFLLYGVPFFVSCLSYSSPAQHQGVAVCLRKA